MSLSTPASRLRSLRMHVLLRWVLLQSRRRPRRLAAEAGIAKLARAVLPVIGWTAGKLGRAAVLGPWLKVRLGVHRDAARARVIARTTALEALCARAETGLRLAEVDPHAHPQLIDNALSALDDAEDDEDRLWWAALACVVLHELADAAGGGDEDDHPSWKMTRQALYGRRTVLWEMGERLYLQAEEPME